MGIREKLDYHIRRAALRAADDVSEIARNVAAAGYVRISSDLRVAARELRDGEVKRAKEKLKATEKEARREGLSDVASEIKEVREEAPNTLAAMPASVILGGAGNPASMTRE